VIAGRDAEPRVAVDDARVPRRDRDVREEPAHEPRAHGGPVQGGDDRLRAVEHVLHDVARLAQHARAERIVAKHRVDQLEAAAGGEGLAGPAEDDDARVRVAVHGEPDVGEVAVHARADGVQPRRVEHDAQDARLGALEAQALEVGIAVGHGSPLTPS